ncbi:hypothetical protein Ciccas_007971 [Cichlidogyrus casuarinus]|uniref:Ribosome biogenesis protein BRX1 homolog n=1 Tax=Cichlidogyrus casuarinus TaxID=1844966 RepID=A0ABD2Q229_9PLAT
MATPIRRSDDPIQRKPQWINRQRVLILSSRGISFIMRHIMKDLACMMPHAKTDSKLDSKKDLSMLTELAAMKNCNKIVYFEARKKSDNYLWLGCMSNGPSAKFYIENIFTTTESKMTGNSLKTSRPLLVFDSSFDDKAKNPHLHLLKEMLVQIFGTPSHHPRSQPYFDKVFSFTWLKNRIWFRNYQIVEESGALAEIGPRLSLNPIKIFSENFGGAVIWENPHYIPPNALRRMMVMQSQKVHSYAQRAQAKEATKERKSLRGTDFKHVDPTDAVFEDSDSEVDSDFEVESDSEVESASQMSTD